MSKAPEIRFLQSPGGIAATVAVSLVALAASMSWARRGDRRERRERTAVLAAATVATALGTGYAEGLRRTGQIGGGYFELPWPVQAAFNGPLSIGLYTLWLEGYRQLARRTWHPFLAYGLLSASYVPLAFKAAPWEVQRGWISIRPGFPLAAHALAAQALLWSGVGAYEAFKRLPAPRQAPVWRPEPLRPLAERTPSPV